VDQLKGEIIYPQENPAAHRRSSPSREIGRESDLDRALLDEGNIVTTEDWLRLLSPCGRVGIAVLMPVRRQQNETKKGARDREKVRPLLFTASSVFLRVRPGGE